MKVPLKTGRRRRRQASAGGSVLGRLPDPADLYRAARVFAGLAHPARIRLACSLANGRAATQKELIEELGWPQSTMARHLGFLRERGLIHATRRGNEVYLGLDGTVTPRLLAVVCEWVHPDSREQFVRTLTGSGESSR